MTRVSFTPTMSADTPSPTSRPYRPATLTDRGPREEFDGRRQRLPSDECGRRGTAVSPRPGDPRLRTAVVEVRRRQGAGDPRAVRHVRDPLLPGSQRPDRHACGPRRGPYAGQATATLAGKPPAAALGTSARHR